MNYSVIVCARRIHDCDELMQSFPYEKYDNFEVVEIVGAKGMSEGYNRGVERAKHDLLIFTHTDVTIWAGRALFENLVGQTMQPEVGFLGVAGAATLPKSGTWWHGGVRRGAVAHEDASETYTTSFGPYGQALVMDGVFLVCERSKLEKIGGFDERFGWHFYDIDSTLRMRQAGFKNLVVPFPILHGSIGRIEDNGWEEARQEFVRKHQLVHDLNL